MLSPFPPSVHLSVTRVNHTKTVEVRIMKFSPYSSPISLVFAEISKGNISGVGCPLVRSTSWLILSVGFLRSVYRCYFQLVQIRHLGKFHMHLSLELEWLSDPQLWIREQLWWNIAANYGRGVMSLFTSEFRHTSEPSSISSRSLSFKRPLLSVNVSVCELMILSVCPHCQSASSPADEHNILLCCLYKWSSLIVDPGCMTLVMTSWMHQPGTLTCCGMVALRPTACYNTGCYCRWLLVSQICQPLGRCIVLWINE